MPKLHELLAAEGTVQSSWNTLKDETLKKLRSGQEDFAGETIALKMLDQSDQNDIIEVDAAKDKRVKINVVDTLDYAFDLYAKAEDLQFQKNRTNTVAKASFDFGGKTFSDIPIDQLLGLEARLKHIHEIIMATITLDATKVWTWDPAQRCYVSMPEYASKTEKKVSSVIMAPATDKHQASFEKITLDVPIGKFTRIKRSGGITTQQKVDMIKNIEALTVAIKMARQRANNIEVVAGTIGKDLIDLIMAPLKKIPE